MPLDISTTLTAVVGNLIGGVVDGDATTDPLTVDAGVTLDGGLTSALGNILGGVLGGALSGVVGDGIRATVQGAAVTNDGTVESAGGTGAAIDLLDGGTVTNTGAATGATAAIAVAGTPAGTPSTVANSGTATATGANGVGIRLDLGGLTNGKAVSATGAGGIGAEVGAGTADNAAGATISGALDGLDTTGAVAVTNAGSIVGTAGTGVNLAAGTLANALGGTIAGAAGGVTVAAAGTLNNAGTISTTGPNGIGVNLLGGGTVIDSGTIGGSDASGAPGGIAVAFGAGNSRLVLAPGAVLNGAVRAAGTGNTLELAAGQGTATVNDIGRTVTGFADTVVDQGAVADVLGAVTAPGTVAVGDGASLTLGGPVAAGVAVDLGGTGARLTLGDPAGFAGTITDLGPDDILDLGALGSGATVAYDPAKGAITVTANGAVADLIPVTLAAGLDPLDIGLTLGTDGNGGTTVTVGGGGGTGTGTGGTGTGTGGTGTGGTGTGSGGTGTGTDSGGTGTSGGGTGTGGGGTNPGGGGTAGTGSVTVAADPTTGGTTVTTTSPSGSRTTQTLPPGSSIVQGTGPAAADLISMDPYAAYRGRKLFPGRDGFTISGHVAAGSGVASVTISASIDGGDEVVLGTAKVAADGSYKLLDKVGPHLQAFITATETDALGNTLSVVSPYSLQAGLHDGSFRAEEAVYSTDGAVATDDYRQDGSRVTNVIRPGQTVASSYFDTFNDHGRADTTFVFDPGYGHDVVTQFRLGGERHDTVSLPSADFQNFAAVLADTQNTASGALIIDPVSGDTVKLGGITKAEMRANPSDFAFHA